MRKEIRENCHVLIGNCLETIKTLPDESVHCCITSPPYYGLRDYGTGEWVGGDENCEHEGNNILGNNRNFVDREGRGSNTNCLSNGVCVKCGAIKEDEQIGLEETPEKFIERLVEVFREIKRVLHPRGTIWVNIGDSYCAGSRKNTAPQTFHNGKNYDVPLNRRNQATGDLKDKDLIGIPWMLAFALRADGWYLRQDIIWHKPNPMPESVKDRCTKSHEYIFLLTKSKHYYYDYEAIKEPVTNKNRKNYQNGSRSNGVNHDRNDNDMSERMKDVVFESRNKRSVWRDTKYESIEEEATYRQGIHKQRGENVVYFRPILPTQKNFVDFIRLNPKENLLNLGIKQSTIDHWYRYDQSGFSYPSVEDWNIIYPYLVNEDKEQMNVLMTTMDWKYDNVDFDDKRNKRSIWTVNTRAYKGAHFAVFPPDLIEPCVLSGCPEKVCSVCFEPYKKTTLKTERYLSLEEVEYFKTKNGGVQNYEVNEGERSSKLERVIEDRNLPDHEELRLYLQHHRKKAGLTIQEVEDYFGTWQPHHWLTKGGSYPPAEDWFTLKELLSLDDTYDKAMTETFLRSGIKIEDEVIDLGLTKQCDCESNDSVAGVVIDPFGGSGTTGAVALKHGRRAILCELSDDYIDLMDKRIESITKLNKAQKTLFNFVDNAQQSLW